MQSLSDIRDAVVHARNKLSISEKTAELNELKEQSMQPDFWNNNQKAQTISKKIASLTVITEPWNLLHDDLQELVELEELGEDVSTQVSGLSSRYDDLKEQLKFNGQYDSFDAIISFYAGAGGTDAQDWAQMLLRMYTRWAEHHDAKVELIDESRGEEAGIKSASIALSGASYLYGNLKGEHGVHRLVRLSPFNSDNLRQTSFAKVDVIPSIDAPEDIQIDDNDLKIDTFRASGNGGQSVNTTDSAVRVTHIPTNIVVSIQNEKSQLQNKETALKILRSRLAQLQQEQHADKLSDLKGPSQANEWGSQIRNYVLHPYKLVKDTRSGHESSDPEKILNGDLDEFISANFDLK